MWVTNGFSTGFAVSRAAILRYEPESITDAESRVKDAHHQTLALSLGSDAARMSPNR